MKMSDIMLTRVTPVTIIIFGVLVIVAIMMFLFRGAAPKITASLVGSNTSCTTATDCRDRFKSCYFTCSSGQCVSFNTLLPLKPYPDCSNASSCTPNWQCGEWSTCVDERQSRNCADTNNCGKTTGMPATSQSCTSSDPARKITTTCTPNWQCGEWSVCDDNRQSRICTDLKNCPGAVGMPATSQYCSYALPIETQQCATATDCRDKFQSCYFTCSEGQCVPLNTLIPLKPFPDCTNFEQLPPPATTTAPNTLTPAGRPTESQEQAAVLQSPSITYLSDKSDPSCEAKCLYGQKDTFGDGNNAVYAVDCAGKTTYCGVSINSQTPICVADEQGARCVANNTPTQQAVESGLVSKITTTMTNMGGQILGAITDTLKSLFNF